PIAVAAEKRSAAITRVPTFAEAGLRDFHSDSWYGILVPAGTPKDVIGKLNAEIRRVLSLPDVREKLAAQGAEPLGNTPGQFAEQIRRDLARWTKVAKEANVRID
ncbi:MAG: tripartite tricarboxylate transporter substrate-binding protein, partial [Betaproteobacteria bacterium]